MNLQALARLGIFGSTGGKAKPSWWKCILGDALYFVAGIDTGLPSVINQIEYYADVLWSAFFGEADELPPDFPAKLYNTISGVILYRGGLFDKETEQPNFFCKRSRCRSNPLMWTVVVDYAKGIDPNKLAGFEASFEEALTAAGYDTNVRVMRRPLRLEIDKPEPPTVKLSDYWAGIGALPRNALWSVPGVTASEQGLVLFARQMIGESFSARIVGRPRAGKTQLALSMLLSIAYTNSPATLAMVIIDPKVIDMMFLATLPHLACSVATRDDECIKVLAALVAEMEERENRLRRGDRSFIGQHIFVYIDEMSDLLASLTGKEREAVIVGVQRLSQKGGGLGFIIVGATQRVYEVDPRMYTKMNDRYALAANNGSDGYAATGVEGVQVHKLPGKGACELYPDGVRLQGFFVADAKAKDYEKQIGRFVTDIRQRWGNVPPCWALEEDRTEQPTEQPTMEAFMEQLRSDGVTGIHAIREAHEKAFGTGIGTRRAREIRALL